VLVYDTAARRLERRETLQLDLVGRAAALIQRFIEGYHERLEEEFLFPRLRAAQREVELVGVLLVQHERGRTLTSKLTALAQRRSNLADTDRSELVATMDAFSRMYRPHAAREDTVLFPAFREVVGGAAHAELGEQFEEREHSLFGSEGFEWAVKLVADIERALGVYDLARFTAPP
jgi:hemerythrin-like domain-containing protein